MVWCPKYRRRVLVNGVDVRLKELIQSICTDIKADIIEMEIMPDLVHMLLEVDPQYGINKAVQHIKWTASHILQIEFKVEAPDSLDQFIFCFNSWRVRLWKSLKSPLRIRNMSKEVRRWNIRIGLDCIRTQNSKR